MMGLGEIEGADIFSAPGEYCFEIKKAVQGYAKNIAYLSLEHNSGGSTLETRVYPVSVPTGERGQFAVLSLDITARKQAELEQVRLNAVLIKKNKEMENYLYITTHDLRSPLVNIQGFSRNLEQYVYDLAKALGPVPYEAKAAIAELTGELIPEALKYIRSSIAKMDSLITALLKISRLGRLELKPKRVAMNELLGTICGSLHFQLEAAGGKVIWGELPPCKADPAAAAHIFTNLLDNAIKYRHKDRAPVITVSGEVKDGMALYKVADNGVGIPAAELGRIWNIFYKHAETEERSGEGIGLPTTRTMAENSGGSVSVQSKEGEGSVFSVELPAAAEVVNAGR